MGITTIKLIYLAINIFLSGMYFESRYSWNSSFIDKIIILLVTIFGIMIATPYVCAQFLILIVTKLWNSIKVTLQIKFWIQYYFGHNFYDLTEDQLNMLNSHSIKMLEEKNNLKSRIYSYSTKLINKRNNFKYDNGSKI